MIIRIEEEFVDRKVLLNDLVRIINSFDNMNIEDLLNIRSNQINIFFHAVNQFFQRINIYGNVF